MQLSLKQWDSLKVTSYIIGFQFIDLLSQFFPLLGCLSFAMMMSIDVTNHNGPAATPPTSLSLRSSHNQLLSSDVASQGSGTPPKCRKKYALTSIQAAMGLGEAVASSSSPISSPSQSSAPSNPKLAKNGVNQLRKAGQDHNKNTSGPESVDLECNLERGALSFSTVDEQDSHTLSNYIGEDDAIKLDAEQHPYCNVDAEPEQDSKLDMETNINNVVELKLDSSTADLDFDLNIEADESDDINILLEKEIMSKMKIEEDGNEMAMEEQEDEEKMPLLLIKSDSPVKNSRVSSGLELISDLHSNIKLNSGKDSLVPPPPSPPRQASPGDMPLRSTVSCSSSSSSSPETKKDRRTGAKTDCALNRIQNLNPSDEELSWTTLSQESNSPEEPGITHKYTTT